MICHQSQQWLISVIFTLVVTLVPRNTAIYLKPPLSLLSGITYEYLPPEVKFPYKAPSGPLKPPSDESDHSPIQLLASVNAIPMAPAPVETKLTVAKPPTSPKSKAKAEPLPASIGILGYVSMTLPVLANNIDLGERVRDGGAYMFNCHFPVSEGPLQLAFLHHA